VRLVTHSDVAITIRSKVTFYPPNLLRPLCAHAESGQTFSDPEQVILIKPQFTEQVWRKEWYSYSGSKRALDFLSDHIPYLLACNPCTPYQDSESLLAPWKRIDRTFLN